MKTKTVTDLQQQAGLFMIVNRHAQLTFTTISSLPALEQIASVNVPPLSIAMRASSSDEPLPFGRIVSVGLPILVQQSSRGSGGGRIGEGRCDGTLGDEVVMI